MMIRNLSRCLLLVSALGVLSPVSATEPEFGKQCALGMSLGNSVPTECSVTWTAQDGKTYCFSSAQSKSRFLSNADENVQRAQQHYQTLSK
jgi:YHS domain-containing protein